MKIGILTLPLNTNYGGILQAYALQTVLEQMGHEVIVLGKSNKIHLPLWKIPLSYSKRILKKYILRDINTRVFFEQWFNQTYPIISQNTQSFIEKYIHYIIPKSLKSLDPNEFNAIVVGSDQIWRPKYFPLIEDAYLAFAENWNIKRLAYAASFGTDEWEYSPTQTKKCKRLAHKFDVITVREASAVNLCQKYFNLNALHVLDPTKLLNKENYIKLFEAAQTPKSPGNMLVYILDETPEKTNLVKHIVTQKGLTPFYVNSQTGNLNTPLTQRIQPPVEQWIRGFYDAEFVVTDSFHACVFAILFHKPFIVYGNRERGLARFNSLLRLFGLENRLVSNLNDINNLAPINYDIVYKKLESMRVISKTLLHDFLQ